MPGDGPPWVVGQNCNLTLQHPAVNGDEPTGFYLKPDSFQVLLPKVWEPGTNVAGLLPSGPIVAGKRVLELVVLSRDGLVHDDGTPSQLTAQQWHTALLAFATQVNSAATLVDPSGTSWTVAIEEMADQLAPLGGQFFLAWETGLTYVEV
jgi:hypothetical protein